MLTGALAGYVCAEKVGGEKPATPSRVPVIIEISAEEVVYSREEGLARARGAVVVDIQRRDVPEQRAKILAGEVVADLQKGIIEARKGARMEAAGGVFSGNALRVDASRREFWVTSAAATAPAGPPTKAGKPRAYFAAKKIAGKADVLYVFRGRITTCDKERPHWALYAREMTYNTKTGRLTIRGGKVRLYGLTVPLISPISVSLKGKEEAARRILTRLSYSRRERMYAKGALAFTTKSGNIEVTSAFRLSYRRGLVGTVMAAHPDPRHEWYVLAERRGDRRDNIDEYLEVDRLPEVGLVEHLIPTDSPKAKTDLLDLTLSGSYVREKPARRYPRHSVAKFHLQLDREFHKDQYDALIGKWWGWQARWEWYDTGQDFYNLQLFAGRGRRFSDRFAASLTALHNIYGGETPLRFDDVDIRTELRPTVDWDLTEKWRIRATARYDVGQGRMRDYLLQLDRKVHCLTWYVRYRHSGSSISVGLELSGLTGGSRPYKQQAEPQWILDWPQQVREESEGMGGVCAGEGKSGRGQDGGGGVGAAKVTQQAEQGEGAAAVEEGGSEPSTGK